MLKWYGLVNCVKVCSRPITARVCRVCYSDSTSYKDKWPAKIRDIEQRNPVRLTRPPQLFANKNLTNRYENRDEDYNRYGSSNRYSRSEYVPDEYDAGNYVERSDRQFYGKGQDEQFHQTTPNHVKREFLKPKENIKAPRGITDSEIFDAYLDNRGSRDTDVFGEYSDESKQKMVQFMGSDASGNSADPEDHFIRLNPTNGPKSTHTFEVKIERLCARAEMSEAQDLFDKIVKEYRVQPTSFMYSNLVRGYAAAGEMIQCFKLYNQLKKMGIKPRNQLYTSLFHSCSNYSGDKQSALKSATNLLGLIRHHGVQLDPITYKAAVKTFGMLGDIETAFQLADECPEDSKYDSYMLSSLLIACNSHKTAGFQLAIGAWRMMRKKTLIQLSTDQYNLLLRSIYTGSGDSQSFKELIQRQVSHDTKQLENGENGSMSKQVPEMLTLSSVDCEDVQLANTIDESINGSQISGIEDGSLINTSSENMDVSPNASLVPSPTDTSAVSVQVKERMFDVLHHKRKIPADVEIKSLASPVQRLLLLGGVRGVLSRMDSHACKPDIKTFFYLLRCLPQGAKSESELLSVMKEYKVVPDGPFYDYILIRMARRRDTTTMWALVTEMKENHIKVEEHTYQILSAACTTLHSCRRLLIDMTNLELQPDLLILKNLLLKASSTNFDHLTMILEAMDRCSVSPDEEFLRIIKFKFRTSKAKLVKQEQSSDVKHKNAIDSELMREYQHTYTHWLKKVEEDAVLQNIVT